MRGRKPRDTRGRLVEGEEHALHGGVVDLHLLGHLGFGGLRVRGAVLRFRGQFFGFRFMVSGFQDLGFVLRF